MTELNCIFLNLNIPSYEEIKKELYQQITCLAESKRALAEPYIIMADAMILFNKVGKIVSKACYEKHYDVIVCWYGDYLRETR